MSKARLATAWLGGCSGCHMSFLDMDAWLFDLAAVADVVYSPIADVKVFPPDVDITLVEGAVANEDNAELARDIRANSTVVVSFGDCAVTGNVTAMRNPPDRDGMLPVEEGIVPPLLPLVLPLHKVIKVDAYLPGCPPPADRIQRAVEALLDGDPSRITGEDIRFG